MWYHPYLFSFFLSIKNVAQVYKKHVRGFKVCPNEMQSFKLNKDMAFSFWIFMCASSGAYGLNVNKNESTQNPSQGPIISNINSYILLVFG